MRYITMMAFCLITGGKCLAQDSTLQHPDNPANAPAGTIPPVHYRPSWTGEPDKYCATMMGGKIVVVFKDKPIVDSKTLNNGIRIMKDGTIILPDGTRRMMKEKTCVDANGKEMM